MGSSCSIVNDTQRDVWITHGINWKVLTAVFRGIAFLLNRGMACAAKRSSNRVAPVVNDAEGITSDVVAVGEQTLRSSKEEAEKVQDDDKRFKDHAQLKKPGEKYTFSGTLSLTMTVYVMNDKGQRDKRACFTGPTHGSEKKYTIAEDFKNLDVSLKKRP